MNRVKTIIDTLPLNRYIMINNKEEIEGICEELKDKKYKNIVKVLTDIKN